MDQNDSPWSNLLLHCFEVVNESQTPIAKDAVFLLTVGSFLLTVEPFCLQLTVLVFYLQLEPFCLQFRFFYLQLEFFCLPWESASNKALKGL